MNTEFNLEEIDASFEGKVAVIADEVLNILKELSRENKQQINSKMIADKLRLRNELKQTLYGSQLNKNAASRSPACSMK